MCGWSPLATARGRPTMRVGTGASASTSGRVPENGLLAAASGRQQAAVAGGLLPRRLSGRRRVRPAALAACPSSLGRLSCWRQPLGLAHAGGRLAPRRQAQLQLCCSSDSGSGGGGGGSGSGAGGSTSTGSTSASTSTSASASGTEPPAERRPQGPQSGGARLARFCAQEAVPVIAAQRLAVLPAAA